MKIRFLMSVVILFACLLFDLNANLHFTEISVSPYFSSKTHWALEGESQKCELLIEMIQERNSIESQCVLKTMLLYKLRLLEKFCEAEMLTNAQYFDMWSLALEELREAEKFTKD